MQRPLKRKTPFLVDEILPAYGIHLLVGPSGVGKTTWQWQFVESWEQGKPVLGYASFPAPWIYIACDRNLEETWDTIERVWTNPPDEHHIIVWDELKQPNSVGSLIALMPKLNIPNGLLIVDGLNMLMGDLDPNKSSNVQSFMKTIQRAAAKLNICILGIVHPAKLKTNEHFQEERWNIAGSSMWGHIASTIIVMANIKGDRKEMRILPRNAPRALFTFEESVNGRLLCVEDENANAQDLADMCMDKIWPELVRLKQFRTSFIIAFAEDWHLARRSAERWINEQVKLGKLERVEKGSFRIAVKQ